MNQYFSPEGLKKIKEELENRKTELRVDISRRIQEAKSLGDISENAEYQEAVAMQSFNEGRIEELENILKNAVVISNGNMPHHHDLVEVGSTVKVSSKHGARQFTIVGSSESNPAQGFISNESPLGVAFLGRKKGDEVEVHTPSGKSSYKILEIL